MSINEQIKQARLLKGWSRYRLRVESGVSETHIRLIEEGKNDPSLRIVEALCRALNIEVKIPIN